jgi:hypothetical protein
MRWALKTGSITQSQANHALAQAHSPIWGVKTADMSTSTKATIILAQAGWLKLVDVINRREREIQVAKHKGLRSKPKSMLPLVVVKIEDEVSSSEVIS